jgi:Mor family transcriptional regulator
MKTCDDLIVFLTRTLREVEPAIALDRVHAVEQRLRQHFGGERVYVAKAIDRRAALREQRVLSELTAGKSVREVAREMSLSIRTIYRIKNRLPRR